MDCSSGICAKVALLVLAQQHPVPEVDIVEQPVAIFIMSLEFVVYQLELVGEQERFGRLDGCGATIESAGGVAGDMDDGFGC